MENITLKGDVNSVLIGDNNDNIINGGSGDDILRGGAGNDILKYIMTTYMVTGVMMY